MKIKYSYLIEIICKQIYLTHRWEPNKSIWSIGGPLTDLFESYVGP